MLVSEIMEIPEKIIQPSDLLIDVADCFAQIEDEELPVVDNDGKLIGVVTRRGLLSAIIKNTNSDVKVDEILETPSQVIQENMKLNQVNWYAEKKIIWIINNKNILVGVLRLSKLGEINTERMFSSFSNFDNFDFTNLPPLSANRLFNSILESSFDGIWIANNKGDTLYINNAYERITGLRKEQLLGKNMRDLLKEKLFEHSTVLTVLDRDHYNNTIYCLADLEFCFACII
jgi:PAS domain-containing protein